jgi:hypothetical protein
VNTTTLKSLSLKDNPVLRESSKFHRRCIFHPSFQHALDCLDKPLFDMERVAAIAWSTEGVEA